MAQSRGDATAAVRFVGRGPHGTLTEQDARELLNEQARRGIPLPDFARSKGLSPQRLHWWRSKFARAETAAPATFVPVTLTPATEAACVPATGAFELALASGRTLRIPADFDATALARLLTVLAEAAR